MPATDLVKLRVESVLGDRVVVETPWAEPSGDGLFRLDNSPWYHGGLNWRDLVRAEVRRPGDFPVVTEVVEPGGHRTVRVLFDPTAAPELQEEVLARATALGATYEGTGGHHEGVYALDLAPPVALDPVRALLDDHAGHLTWRLGGDPDFLLALHRASTTGNGIARPAEPVDPEAGERVLVALDEDEQRARWEGLWARDLGDGRLRVAGVPFLARDVAVGDVVAVVRAPGRLPIVTGVAERGGRWTLRAYVDDGAEEGALIAEAERLGSRWARAPDGLLAFDVPDADAAVALRRPLDRGERQGRLRYETGWR